MSHNIHSATLEFDFEINPQGTLGGIVTTL